MVQPWFLLGVTALYLSLLFLLAYFSEQRARAGRSVVANGWVYSLSLGVYCTSWTFYGSVGKAANSGLLFLTIYLGPTLMAIMWWGILRKMIKVAREHRLTTIADFIGSRYGNSMTLAAIVTVVATIGISPYLGLQVKAILSTFAILAGPPGSNAAGWIIVCMIAAFAVIFGVRGHSEKHEGLVFVIATESVVKLVAFLAVGAFVSFFLFSSPMAMLEKMPETSLPMSIDYSEWAAMLFLSMMAIMFLPRQFHMAVVENHDERHIRKAMWLLPLYLLVINLFVLPVALGGLLLGGSPADADTFVLSIPLEQGAVGLAMVVFIGGFAAASGMIIVESLAISNMVMNNLVNPILFRFNKMQTYTLLVNNIKRIVILFSVWTGYLFAVSVGESTSLVDMGLISFEAVCIFAPTLILGLYWKGGNRNGAIAGVLAGFVVWAYTALLPSLVNSGVVEHKGFVAAVMDSYWLDPEALFGLTGLGHWGHALFWILLFNLVFFVSFSLFTRQDAAEERQALRFVSSYSPKILPARSSVEQIETLLGRYIGRGAGRRAVQRFFADTGIKREDMDSQDLILLRDEARRTMSSALGSAIATMVFEDPEFYEASQRSELLEEITGMNKRLRLSREDLADANRQLLQLKEFRENIIESLPQGVSTMDADQRVRYWNGAMKDITGVPATEALGKPISRLLENLEPNLFEPEPKMGETLCRLEGPPVRELEARVSELTGSAGGYVLVLDEVTERRRIEEELFMATKHASIGRLAAGVSHEIGNPLASISSLVQEMMLEENCAFVDESLVTINQNVDRIARIVRNLGDFARLYPRQKHNTNLKQSLENTLSLVLYDKSFRKIKVQTELVVSPQLRMDPDQIQQVFLNLILNAKDAMPEGGELFIGMLENKERVEITFRDTGCGIDKEMRGMVFDPFFTTKGPRGGTGLGLSICYSIIKDHGGTIEIESRSGKGTAFVISLPLENKLGTARDT